MDIRWGYIALAVLLALACLLMIGLKLFGVIDWSWAWVFAPIYVPLIAGVCLFFVAMNALTRDGWH